MKKIIPLIIIPLSLLIGCKKKSTQPDPAPAFEVVKLETSPTRISVGRDIELTAIVYNPDSDTLSYFWTISSGTLKSIESNPVIWSAPDSAGSVSVSLEVKNQNGETVSFATSLQVADQKPVFEGFNISRKTVVVGNTIPVTLKYTEPDSQEISLSWHCSGGTFNEISGDSVVWQAPLQESEVNIWVDMTDGTYNVVSDSLHIQVYREYGCLWIVERGKKQLSKYSDNGVLLSAYKNFQDPLAVKVNQRDKSCWVSDGSFQESSGKIVRVSFNGDTVNTIGNFTQIIDMDVYTLEKDVWALDAKDNKLYLISAVNFSILKTISGFNHAQALEINQATRQIWVADTDNDRVIRFDPDVPDMYNVNVDSGYHQITMVQDPVDISVDNAGDAVWVAQRFQQKITLLRTGFSPLVFANMNHPMDVQATPDAYVCWIADTGNNRLLKIDQDHIVLTVEDGFLLPTGMAMNVYNGNFWVIDSENNRVVKLDENGNILTQIIGLDSPWDIALNLGQ